MDGCRRSSFVAAGVTVATTREGWYHPPPRTCRAEIAQLVEQGFRKAQVASSSLALGSTLRRDGNPADLSPGGPLPC